MRKLAVCYPGETSHVFATSFHSIANIVAPPGCEVRWFRGGGWCQARRRIHAAEQALDWGADLIATLDIDQVYDPDILCRLVDRHDKGADVIAAMVPMRGYVASSGMRPFQRLAWRFADGQFVPVDPEDGELQSCEFPTSAAMLFSAEFLRRLSKPWYYTTHKPDDWSQVHGEDATFVLRMQRELGITAWVDTSIRVRHAHVFEIDETFSERFSDWSEPGVGDDRICGYQKGAPQ